MIMTTPAPVDVSDGTRDLFDALAHGDLDLLGTGLEARAEFQIQSGLDSRAYALVKIAALIAVDAPPASYVWQVANAINEGATPEDILGVLIAVAPQVGGPRVVAAAPEIMIALGLTIADDV
jgi:4-carboxymuconolactone decarboxylase